MSDTGWLERIGSPGTYALVIRVREPIQRRVGSLGAIRFDRGWFVYVGSAMRGLKGRIGRHLRLNGPVRKPRWHIDYLLERARVEEVWFHVGRDREECGAAGAVARIPGAMPIKNFGASDCGCGAHLFHFIEPPEPLGLLRNWRRLPADDMLRLMTDGELCGDIMLPGDLVRAEMIKRENRFVALAKVKGRKLRVHVPNTGRLAEFFAPGNPAMLLPAANPERKTAHTLVLARDGGVWCDIDSIQANRTFGFWLAQGRLHGFEGWKVTKAEFTYDKANRFDFLIEHESGKKGLVEVKCVTLVGNGVALFPDSPSERGVKHLKTLVKSMGKGYEPFFVFMVQRHDANRVWPNAATDPIFARSLRDAARAGVRTRAYRCRITPERIEYGGRIPVELPPVMVAAR